MCQVYPRSNLSEICPVRAGYPLSHFFSVFFMQSNETNYVRYYF